MYNKTVRFNLGLGQNYLKVKVSDKRTQKSEYLDPEGLVLLLTNCKLVNRAVTAQKIHAGQNKAVCSWVACSKVERIEPCKGYEPIFYNPRVAPYWRDASGNNIDGMMFGSLVMVGTQIYMRGA